MRMMREEKKSTWEGEKASLYTWSGIFSEIDESLFETFFEVRIFYFTETPDRHSM